MARTRTSATQRQRERGPQVGTAVTSPAETARRTHMVGGAAGHAFRPPPARSSNTIPAAGWQETDPTTFAMTNAALRSGDLKGGLYENSGGPTRRPQPIAPQPPPPPAASRRPGLADPDRDAS